MTFDILHATCYIITNTDAACFARASDSPFFRLARAFSWLHIFSVNKTLWISRLGTSDSPSVFEAETNKIYMRRAPVLEIWKEEIKMEEIISALKVVRKYSQKNLAKELNFCVRALERNC